MSLLWAYRISLTLLHDTIFLRRQAHGTRTAQAETLVVKADGNLGELLFAAEKAIREQPGWLRAGKLTVILGNNRVRYAALPWVDDFMRREERLSYARIAMSKLFGPVTEQWDIRLSEADYGDPWLACGSDRALLEQIDTLALACRWRLVSVQPALMTVANEFRLRLAHGAVRLIMVERGRVVFARLEDGRWRQVRTRRLANLDNAALQDLIAQEVLLDPDEAWNTSRLCLWAFSATGEQRAAWQGMGAEVLENYDMQNLLSQRRS